MTDREFSGLVNDNELILRQEKDMESFLNENGKNKGDCVIDGVKNQEILNRKEIKVDSSDFGQSTLENMDIDKNNHIEFVLNEMKSNETGTTQVKKYRLISFDMHYPSFETWHLSSFAKSFTLPKPPSLCFGKLTDRCAKTNKLGLFSSFRSQKTNESKLFDFSNFLGSNLEPTMLENISDLHSYIVKLKGEYIQVQERQEKYLCALFFYNKQKQFVQLIRYYKYFVLLHIDNQIYRDIGVIIDYFQDEARMALSYLYPDQWESPRLLMKRLSNVLHITSNHLSTLNEGDWKQISGLIQEWNQYFYGLIPLIDKLASSNDDVVIISVLKAIHEMRDSFATFGSVSQQIDNINHTNLMLTTQRALKNSVEYIINYISVSEIDDFVTLPQAIAFIKGIIDHYSVLIIPDLDVVSFTDMSVLIESTIDNILSDISCHTIEICDVDRYSEFLGRISDNLENIIIENHANLNINKIVDLHSYITSVRYNVLHLHSADSEKDIVFSKHIGAVISDLSSFQNAYIVYSKESDSFGDLSNDCLSFLQKSMGTLCSIDSILDIVPRNPERYMTIKQFLSHMSSKIQMMQRYIGENLLMKTYISLVTSVQIAIEYISNVTNRMNKNNSSIIIENSSSIIRRVSLQSLYDQNHRITDIDFSVFSNGFIDEPMKQKALITSYLISKEAEDNDENMRHLFGSLILAQIDALSRNYNIGLNSTQVLFQLITSIVHSIRIVSNQISSKDYNNIKTSIDQTIQRLQDIQIALNEKEVYTEFGKTRLVVFLKLCSLISNIVLISNHFLIENDFPFNDSSLQCDLHELKLMFSSLPKYRITRVILFTKELIILASQENSNQNDLEDIINLESSILSSIDDIVQGLMQETDVRFIKGDSMNIEELNRSIQLLRESSTINIEINAVDARRLLDDVSDNFYSFSSYIHKSDFSLTEFLSCSSLLSKSVRVFYDTAICIKNNNQYLDHYIFSLKSSLIEVLTVLKYYLSIGTQRLFDDSVKSYISSFKSYVSKSGRRISLLEQLDSSNTNDTISTLCVRQAKLFLQIRDDIQIEYGHSKEFMPMICTLLSSIYDTIAQILLTLKTQETNDSFHSIIWETQDLLDIGEVVLTEIKSLNSNEDIFCWMKTYLFPIIEHLSDLVAKTNFDDSLKKKVRTIYNSLKVRSILFH